MLKVPGKVRLGLLGRVKTVAFTGWREEPQYILISVFIILSTEMATKILM